MLSIVYYKQYSEQMEMQSQDSMERSLLLEDRESRRIQRLEICKRLKKRWLSANAVLVSILLIFTLVAAIEAHKFKAASHTRSQIAQQIGDAEQMLQYNAVNKSITFDAQSQLQKVTITSIMYPSNPSTPSIRNLNLSSTKVNALYEFKVPTLTAAALPPSIKQFQECILGIDSLDLEGFPNMSSIMSSEFANIERLDTTNTSMFSIQNVKFDSLKDLVLGNQQFILVQMVAPSLQTLTMRNVKKMISFVITSTSRLRSVTCSNCTVKQFAIAGSHLRDIKDMCGFQAIAIHNSPLEEIGCEGFPSLRTIQFSNTPLKHVSIHAPNLVSVTIEACPIQSIQLSWNITRSISTLNLINTSLTSISNLTQCLGQIFLKENPNLVLFSNNTMPDTSIVSIFECPVREFTQNNLPQTTFITVLDYEGNGKLVEFSNNTTPQLLNLTLEMNRVSSIKGNDFRSLKSLNLSANRMNDQSVQELVTNNTWNKETLITLDISGNSLSDKQRVKTLLEEAFPQAQIYI